MNEIKYYEQLLNAPHKEKIQPPGGLTWKGFWSLVGIALLVFAVFVMVFYPMLRPFTSEYDRALYQAEVLQDKRFIAYTVDGVKYVKFFSGRTGTIYGPTKIDTFILSERQVEVE